MELKEECIESVLEIKQTLVSITKDVDFGDTDIDVVRSFIAACNDYLDTVRSGRDFTGNPCNAPTAVSVAYPPRTKVPAEAPYQYGHYLLVSGRVTARGNRVAPRCNNSSHYFFIAFYTLF